MSWEQHFKSQWHSQHKPLLCSKANVRPSSKRVVRDCGRDLWIILDRHKQCRDRRGLSIGHWRKNSELQFLSDENWRYCSTAQSLLVLFDKQHGPSILQAWRLCDQRLRANTGQILGPAAAINAGSVDVDGTSIKDSSITSTQLTNNIRSDIGAGTGNGNSNLTNNNVSISGSRITSGTVSDSRLANNVSKKGNTGNLFASSTNISGGQINTGIVTGGNLTINSTNYQPNAGNGGFALGIPASGTGAGRFVVGSADEFMWWDGSRLKLQGEVINVGPEYTSGRLLTKYVFDRASVGNISGNNTGAQSITGILDQLGGAGVYGFAICGGGGGGANTRPSNHKAFGGGAGGMALFVYDWNGSEAITVNLGTGGTANNDNNNNFSANGNAGNGSTFAIAGNTRVTANGGAAGNRATNGTATAVNSGQTRANATFNAANTDFPAFSHICTSGISGGTGAAHQAGMGGGGIQITPWNPTGVFTLANSADSGTTPVTNSNNYGYGSSGGCPWGPGVATGGSNNTRVSNSPFRLDAGSAGLSGTTTNSPPGDRVVHPSRL